MEYMNKMIQLRYLRRVIDYFDTPDDIRKQAEITYEKVKKELEELEENK
jgi:hypothetical protein